MSQFNRDKNQWSIFLLRQGIFGFCLAAMAGVTGCFHVDIADEVRVSGRAVDEATDDAILDATVGGDLLSHGEVTARYRVDDGVSTEDDGTFTLYFLRMAAYANVIAFIRLPMVVEEDQRIPQPDQVTITIDRGECMVTTTVNIAPDDIEQPTELERIIELGDVDFAACP